MRAGLSVAAVTAGLLAASVAVAAPAAADHLVVISPSGCGAGALTFDVFGTIETRHRKDVSIAVRPDGSVVATCEFKGIPKTAVNEVTGEPWERPRAGTTDDVTGCVLLDYKNRPFAGRGEWFGEGTATFRHGNKVRTVCTFDPSFFEGMPAGTPATA